MNILDSYIELIYGFEVTDPYVINQITRVIGYLEDNKYTDEQIMHHLLHYGPVISEVLFNGLTQCIPYLNGELVLEPKAPIWHPEKGTEVFEYYREPKCNFTMNDLLDIYYSKLKIPYELQDRKRDGGAFNHMLDKYKLGNISSLDYVITMIKLAEENEMRATSPFDIEKYNSEAFELLQETLSYKRPNIIWRNK